MHRVSLIRRMANLQKKKKMDVRRARSGFRSIASEKLIEFFLEFSFDEKLQKFANATDFIYARSVFCFDAFHSRCRADFFHSSRRPFCFI